MRPRTSRSSGCDWPALAELRRRGQRPADGVWVCDDFHQRRHLVESGVFCAAPPFPDDEPAVTGLEVYVIATKTERIAESMARLWVASPKLLAIYYRNAPREVLP
ncbi:MAG: hypothetical protein ACP5P4_15100 [Steroidobacteraceae bacterium]